VCGTLSTHPGTKSLSNGHCILVGFLPGEPAKSHRRWSSVMEEPTKRHLCSNLLLPLLHRRRFQVWISCLVLKGRGQNSAFQAHQVSPVRLHGKALQGECDHSLASQPQPLECSYPRPISRFRSPTPCMQSLLGKSEFQHAWHPNSELLSSSLPHPADYDGRVCKTSLVLPSSFFLLSCYDLCSSAHYIPWPLHLVAFKALILAHGCGAHPF